jgi:hypothetical protein
VALSAGLTLGAKFVAVPGSAGSNAVVLSANPSNTAWTASTTTPWLHLSNSSGAGTAAVGFTFDANPNAAPRTGNIGFNNGALTFTVYQGGSGYFSAYPPATVLPSGALQVTADYLGNVFFLTATSLARLNPVTQQVTTLASGLTVHPGEGSYVVADLFGNVYFLDGNSAGTVKKWDPISQQVSTVSLPTGANGIAVDLAGNLYFTDLSNIYRWNPATQMTTTVVSGLHNVEGLAVNAAGDIYFTSNPVMKWTAATQTVSSVGYGGGAKGVAVDLAGNLYIASTGAGYILKIDPSLHQTVLATNVNFPFTVGVDGSGTVYYADATAGAIESATPALIPQEITESTVGGTDTFAVIPPTASFTPQSDQDWLTVSGSSNGVVSFAVTADPSNQRRIGHIALLGQSVTVNQGQYLLGASVLAVGQSAGATGVTLGVFPSSASWTASTNDPFLHLAAGSTSGAASAFLQFTYDANNGAGPRTGTININGGNLSVSVVQAGNQYVPFATIPNRLFSGPPSIVSFAPDPNGNIYYGKDDGTLNLFNPKLGQATVLLTGLPSLSGGLTIDRDGNVNIGSTANFPGAAAQNVVQWNQATGNITTLFAVQPAGIVSDSFGNLFASDPTNNAIVKYNEATQQLTTVISGLTGPQGIAVDGQDNLYFLEGLVGNGPYSPYKFFASTQQLVQVPLAGVSSVAADLAGNVFLVQNISNFVANNGLFQFSFPNRLTGLVTDGGGNVYIASVDPVGTPVTSYQNGVSKSRIAFVGPASFTESPGAGSDSASVIPQLPNSSVFPVSDQAWLTVPPVANGPIPFSFTANTTGAPRTAHILINNNASIGVTQTANPVTFLSVSPASTTYSASAQNILIGAQLQSALGTVNVGTVVFTILDTSNHPVANSGAVPVVSGVASTSVTLPGGLPAGTYTIGAAYAGSGNFVTANGSNTLTINALSQTIVFGPLGNQLVGSVFPVSATATSGLPVSFSSLTPTVCAVSGNTVTAMTLGTCTIQASQAGNGTFPAAPNVTQSFTVLTAQGGQAYITAYNPGPVRNNYSGFVGMEFITRSGALSVSALGRIYLPGNTGTHIVKIVRADGTDVAGASVSITMNGSVPAGAFQYGLLAQSVILKPGTTYFLVSQEQFGGDTWYDYGPIGTVDSAAAAQGPAYQSNIYNLVAVPQPSNWAYLGANMLFAAGVGIPIPSVSITSPAAGATISGQVPLTATASAAPGLRIVSVSYQVDGVAIQGSRQTAPPYQATLDTTTLSDGPHDIRATATDDAGDSPTTAALIVTVANGAAQPAGTELVTGATFQSVRNNYQGFVGMKFTVGSYPITVQALGRIYVGGNTGVHLVKLANGTTGVDVPGGTASVNMAGGTSAQYKYAALAAPVVLSANTSYILVSQETVNGDQWYDYSRVTGSGAVNSIVPVYGTQAPYFTVQVANYSFVPVNLLYTANSGVSANPPFIQQQAPGPVRNNYSGFVGMQFSTAGTPLTVTQLGRICITGNNATHLIKLVRMDGNDVPGGTATLAMAGCTGGAYAYVTLSSPLTLAPNTTYYLVTLEVSGGDQWYDYGPVTTSSVGSVNYPAYSAGGAYVLVQAPGYAYGPVNFLYQ